MSAFTTFVVAAALAVGQSSLEISPQAEKAFARSVQLERARKLDAAIESLEQLEAAQQNTYLVQVRLGLLHYNAGKYDAARSHYSAAVKLAPASREARNGLILTVLAQGHYSYAEQLARQVVEIDADNYFANLRLAYALRMQSKFREATTIHQKMLEQYPTDVSFLLESGLASVGLKQNDEAKTVFSRVILLDPDNVLAKDQLARLAR